MISREMHFWHKVFVASLKGSKSDDDYKEIIKRAKNVADEALKEFQKLEQERFAARQKAAKAKPSRY